MDLQRANEKTKKCKTYCSQCEVKGSLVFSGNISLCSITQSIIFDDKRIKLSNRALRVLCALLQCKGSSVSFNYLHEYGWPDSLVVRNNLTVTISEIRTTLRHTNIKIQNIRGFGYALTSSNDEIELIKDTELSLIHI